MCFCLLLQRQKNPILRACPVVALAFFIPKNFGMKNIKLFRPKQNGSEAHYCPTARPPETMFMALAFPLKAFIIGATATCFVELAFRWWYRRKYRKDFIAPVKYAWRDQYICSHPNFSVAHIPGKVLKHRQLVPYPFNKECLSMTDTQVINNAGYQSHRDYFFEKSPNTLRVAYLGNSTTANILSDGKRDYSIPALTEERLQTLLGSKMDCEVYSFATMAWVSTDLVACMALHVVHYKPDVLVLYHGMTDLYIYLTDDFDETGKAVTVRHDYTHDRRNIGVTLTKHWLVNKLVPRISWLWCIEYLKKKTCGTGDLRSEFVDSLRSRKINSVKQYSDMGPRKEHLRTILTLCSALDIPVVIPEFCCANLDRSRVSNNIEVGIQLENKQMRELAEEFQGKGHRVWYLDGTAVKRGIPDDADHFGDWIHFAPKGMERFADVVSEFIAGKVGADMIARR